ncbi:hypothetical protein BO70DRAFT_104757 [Aspergillus heteromorphus CBS 117.55]|uniref:DUF3669 domain-containing protein n=1 Tax=Aspergillus heteromorphus CBS 117.55 TaxID=1448321 RepID=A0A317VN29_9EURO|nr:uncharacterized protein BO70DRAFT_104757 [Aspergillus heteromorphus CBS 117.55]PWY74338.1 hypothetical protein BO70DRAFT_104757 [Aspergillus heteromorphus CBS 117.55]
MRERWVKLWRRCIGLGRSMRMISSSFSFDCCRSMSMDLDGVQQAVTAFWRNDPFYPRAQTDLWAGFREQYLKTTQDSASASTFPEERLVLALLFIGLIEGRARDSCEGVLGSQ